MNFGGQSVQAFRWYDYHYLDGRSKWEKFQAEAKAKEGFVDQAKDKIDSAAKDVKSAVSTK